MDFINVIIWAMGRWFLISTIFNQLNQSEQLLLFRRYFWAMGMTECRQRGPTAEEIYKMKSTLAKKKKP
tara:strand:- start:384 stop:590 length:207 start_codon:yes stop_codon:yes gene_type:complete